MKSKTKKSGSDDGTRGNSRVLAETVYDTLRHEILTFALPPRTRLNEASLVDRFQMSRTPVREALRRLSLEGLVDLRPHSGASVTSLDLDSIVEYFEAVYIVQKAVLVLAAERHSEAELAAAEQTQAELELASDRRDANRIPLLNRAFHSCLAAGCRNDRMIGYYERLLDDGLRLSFLPLQNYIASDWSHEMAELIRDHRDILAAFRQRDGEAVATVSDRHTDLFRTQVLAALTSHRPEARAAADLAANHLIQRNDKHD